MSVTFDIGCGSDPERWRPGAYKFDLEAWDIERSDFETIDDLELAAVDEHVIGFDFRTETLPAKDETVDAIYMRHSLSYMWETYIELVERLRECSRVLRVGGLLLIQDYCHQLEANGYVDVDYEDIHVQLVEALEHLPDLEIHFGDPCRCGDEYVWIFERVGA